MENLIYSDLYLREVFHIEFLRWLGRKLKAGNYAVKGGVNLRLFFKSPRYSEDMDLDVAVIGVAELKELAMRILQTQSFKETLYAFGIKDIIPPDMKAAKQTQTTQRFEIHLLSASGEDLFTKIEFSRRGFTGNVIAEAVPDIILRNYRLTPLIAAHYDAQSAAMQKINALASRKVIQARDIFDLYILSSQADRNAFKELKPLTPAVLSKAYERIFDVSFAMFKDTVVSYLAAEDQNAYSNSSSWEEVRLRVANFIEELK